jgi:hypothetical protein
MFSQTIKKSRCTQPLIWISMANAAEEPRGSSQQGVVTLVISLVDDTGEKIGIVS